MPYPDPIPIVSAADEGYAPHLGAMLHSLFRSNPNERFDVHYLHRKGLDSSTLSRLEHLCQRHRASFYPLSVDPALLAGLAIANRYREEAWYRLRLPSLLPTVPRALWLDADLLVLQPLTQLWATDLRGKSLAAVPNAMSPHHLEHVRALGVDPSEYFNTGVMLLNLAQMRATGAESRLQQSAVQNQGHNLFADQDVFCPVFSGDFEPLALHWNVTAGAYLNARESVRLHGWAGYRNALRQPRVVHFTQQKPWLFTSSHPYRNLYIEHRCAAGWPPPAYGEQPWWRRMLRRLPMTIRILVSHPARLSLADVLTRAAVWLTAPHFKIQRLR